MVRVTVAGIPVWVDAGRLLGPGEWEEDASGGWSALLDRRQAADVQARLRGWGIGGTPLVTTVVPPLKRPLVRQARADEAVRRRARTPGFLRRGTRLDREGQVSLTPEALAMTMAERVAGLSVVDATAGAGGNAIAFARHDCRVVAIEPQAERRRLLEHNARLYGVRDRIQIVAGRAPNDLPKPADLLFIDVPWGTEYDPNRVVLDDLPLLADILQATSHWPRVWAKLPPSFDVTTLAGTPEAWFGVAPGDRQRVKFIVIEVAREVSG
ncbi:MAG: hypothetical protein AAGA48_17990 [Myxococcota bacterium]